MTSRQNQCHQQLDRRMAEMSLSLIGPGRKRGAGEFDSAILDSAELDSAELIAFRHDAKLAKLPPVLSVPSGPIKRRTQLSPLTATNGEYESLKWWNQIGYFQVPREKSDKGRTGKRVERLLRVTYSGVPRYCFTQQIYTGGTATKQYYIDIETGQIIKRTGSSHNGESNGHESKDTTLFESDEKDRGKLMKILKEELVRRGIAFGPNPYWTGFTQQEEFYVPKNQKGCRNVLNKPQGEWPINTWVPYVKEKYR